MNASKPAMMVPVSGRIPEELYHWLSATPLEGATTVSDKLRVAVSTLKRLHDGDADYEGALSMYRDLQASTRTQLSRLEETHGHSEVLATLMEHAPAVSASLSSAQIDNLAAAQRVEALATRRCLQLAESLLRQALTSHTRAYGARVITDNIQGLLELAALIQRNLSPSTPKEQA